MKFPTNTVEFSFKEVVGEDTFGNDIWDTVKEEVAGVVLVGVNFSDPRQPFQAWADADVELHLPDSYSKSVKGATFEALTGPFTGRTFKVIGDPVAYEWKLFGFNRRVMAEEFYRGQS